MTDMMKTNQIEACSVFLRSNSQFSFPLSLPFLLHSLLQSPCCRQCWSVLVNVTQCLKVSQTVCFSWGRTWSTIPRTWTTGRTCTRSARMFTHLQMHVRDAVNIMTHTPTSESTGWSSTEWDYLRSMCDRAKVAVMAVNHNITPMFWLQDVCYKVKPKLPNDHILQQDPVFPVSLFIFKITP